MFSKIIEIARRECKTIFTTPIYVVCMIALPVFVTVFFTTLMDDGQPVELPVGVVDMDKTATTRHLIHTLDGFQTSHVVAHYPNVDVARNAMQRGEIYAFLYIPKGTTAGMMSSKQPKISFYYNSVVMLAGSTTFKDLKTISTLGSAAVGKTKLSMLGKTDKEIVSFLMPITIDLHMLSNPWANYNVYLSTAFIPGLFMLFIFLITSYSIGMELKMGTGKEWMKMAGYNPLTAIVGKLLPQSLIFLTIFYCFEFYIYYILDFPHPGGLLPIMLLGFLAVFSAQSIGVFAIGFIPSLRMSMSVCALWGMLSFSIAGATYPVDAMDPILQGIAWLFPLRHYYMIYQINIFNGFTLDYAWIYWTCLLGFCILPLFVVKSIRRTMLEFEYME